MTKQKKYGASLIIWVILLFLKITAVISIIFFKPGYTFEVKGFIENALSFAIGILILIRAFYHDRYLRHTEGRKLFNFIFFLNQTSPKDLAILCLFVVLKPYIQYHTERRIRILRGNIHLITLGTYILIIGLLILVF